MSMRKMTLGAIALLAGVGLVHGTWVNRWSPLPTEDAFRPQLSALADRLGPWQGDPPTFEQEKDEPVSTFMRRYAQPRGGRSVLVSLTYGRPGEVAVHTPELCYPGSGFELIDAIAPRNVALDGKPAAQFLSATFLKKRPTGSEAVRVSWSWSTDGEWGCPRFPRLYYARSANLFKLYVIRAAGPNETEADRQAYAEFESLFVGELNRKLFGP